MGQSAWRRDAENFKLRVEIAQLRATVVDLEMRLLSHELTSEQKRLEAKFRAEEEVASSAAFDWDTLEFKRPDVDDQH